MGRWDEDTGDPLVEILFFARTADSQVEERGKKRFEMAEGREQAVNLFPLLPLSLTGFSLRSQFIRSERLRTGEALTLAAETRPSSATVQKPGAGEAGAGIGGRVASGRPVGPSSAPSLRHMLYILVAEFGRPDGPHQTYVPRSHTHSYTVNEEAIHFLGSHLSHTTRRPH